MDRFICKHGEVIHGALSCFDRMLFRGYLPIMSGAAMADFLQAKGIDRWGLKTFLLTQAACLKKHAMEMAAAAGRPYQYLGERTRKEAPSVLSRPLAVFDKEALLKGPAVEHPSDVLTYRVPLRTETPPDQSDGDGH